ncbi:MAG TPA: hypothetical protein VFE98_11305 [Candidatus Bathyarchaeia archaeon]|nr:hypothetical protein [Candidatus Bathyarchaeia archaeon]
MMDTTPNTININGVLGWTVNQITHDAVKLNVSRDLTVSSDGGASLLHSKGSFNESVNLATRIVTFDRAPEPELESAMSMAKNSMTAALPAGTDLSASLPTMSDMIKIRPLYTAWWVNLPLKEKDQVPVLVFPTTVKGSATIDLGSLGKHTAWTLIYNLTRPDPFATMRTTISRPTPVGFDLKIILTFNYDKNSGVLLEATAEVHADAFAPSPCSTPGMMCPLTDHPILVREFSFDLQASLKLSSTSLNLDGPLTTGISDTQPTTTSGSNPGANPGTTPGPSSTPSGSRPAADGTLLARLTPLGYWLLGIIGVAVAGIVGALKLYKRTK